MLNRFFSWKVIFKKALTRPFALFAHEPIIQLLGLYMAFIYGTLYSKLLIQRPRSLTDATHPRSLPYYH